MDIYFGAAGRCVFKFVKDFLVFIIQWQFQIMMNSNVALYIAQTKFELIKNTVYRITINNIIQLKQ